MEILPKMPLNSGNHPHLHHEDSKIEKKLQLRRTVYCLRLQTATQPLPPWPAAGWNYL